MPRFVHWIQVIWGWRNNHPTASCVVTGLWGVSGLLVGIVSVIGHSAGSGVFLSLIGAGLLGLVIYAGYDTDWFKRWDTVRIEGHSLARSIGPLTLCAAVLITVVYFGLLYLTASIIRVGFITTVAAMLIRRSLLSML